MLSLLLNRPARRTVPIEQRASGVTGYTLTSDAFASAFGAGKTIAGPTISEATALTISVVFCAHDLRASALMMCPHKIYERMPDGGRQEATDDHRYGIVHRRPNRWFGAKRFRWLMCYWRDTWGNAYAEKEYTRGGKLIGLNPIHPANVRIRIEDGEVLYDVVRARGGTITLTAERMLHWPGPSDDGIRGLSLVGLARQSLGYTVAAEEYGARFLGNNGLPGLMFISEHKWPPEVKREWLRNFQAEYAGDGTGAAMISDEGLKPHPIGSMPMKDAQFLELRQFQVLDYARYTHVPAHKLMNLERATFSNIESQAIEYVGDAIQPISESFAETINLAIFSEDEQLRLYSELNLDGLLRADSKTRAEAMQLQRQNGVINSDEWRAMENRNALPDGQGKIFVVPSNMQSLSQVKKQDDQPLPDPNGRKNDKDENRGFECLKPCFLDAFHRLWIRESDRISSLRRKPDADSQIEKFVLGRREHVESALLPVFSGLTNRIPDVGVVLAGIAARHIERLRRDALANRMESEESRRIFAESEWEALKL